MISWLTGAWSKRFSHVPCRLYRFDGAQDVKGTADRFKDGYKKYQAMSRTTGLKVLSLQIRNLLLDGDQQHLVSWFGSPVAAHAST